MRIKCIGGSSADRSIDIGEMEIKSGYVMMVGPSISPYEFVKERYLIKKFRQQVVGGYIETLYAIFDEMPQVSDLEIVRTLQGGQK
jgi:hypothetical protein